MLRPWGVACSIRDRPSERTTGLLFFTGCWQLHSFLRLGRVSRSQAESAVHAWIIKLDFVLPQAAVWTEHLQAAIGLLAVSVGYAVYVWHARLGGRLRLDRVRVKGLIGRRFARWGTINIALYWLFFAVMLTQLLTGGLLYFGYANSFMLRAHLYGMWAIVAYVAVHLYSHWHYGGIAQLMRVFRPKHPVRFAASFRCSRRLGVARSTDKTIS